MPCKTAATGRDHGTRIPSALGHQLFRRHLERRELGRFLVLDESQQRLQKLI
jgi:hypothetical protein